MLLQNCPPVLSSISVFSICKGCQSFSKHKILGACKHKQIPVLHRCEQTRWRPMPPGRLPGHWYRVDLILWGEIHQRWTLYYGSLLRETMGLTSTKNKYLFAQWDGEHRDLHTGPRSLDYNSLLLHLKIPIHIFLLCLGTCLQHDTIPVSDEWTEQNHLKNCIMLLYWC